ncbi:hypothetical protein BK374_14770 [Escherichia coli]|nr:hypothetical protein BK374_14770 [Escherichia coli]
MAALPYMQLYIADYLADTMHLSAASMRSVGMLTNLNYEAMKTLLGERIMDRMTMNGGRWVNFNWESWRPNVVQPGIAK